MFPTRIWPAKPPIVSQLERDIDAWFCNMKHGCIDLDVRELPEATESPSAWCLGIVSKRAAQHTLVVEKYSLVSARWAAPCLTIQFRNGRVMDILL